MQAIRHKVQHVRIWEKLLVGTLHASVAWSVIVISKFIINIYKNLIETSAGYLLCRNALSLF